MFTFWTAPWALKLLARKGSSANMSVPRLKISVRMGFTVKIECFSHQNGDENRPRRQKMKFPDQKRWREPISSPKLTISHPKLVTRANLVVKIDHFSPQNGDENRPRRQKMKFPDQKRWRERVSSSKLTITHPKMVTRANLVVKIGRFPHQIGDEIGFRRHKWPFPT